MNKLTMKIASVVLGTTVLFSGISQASAATYIVKSGDSLSKIAKTYKTTYTAIMKSNNLKTTNLKVGQKLTINGTATTTTAKTTTASKSTSVVSIANQYLGVKYRFGGKSPSTGFDCSGYVSYVFKKAGILSSYSTASGLYSKSKKISSPKVGDLVFFSNTYQKGISHVGIYIGNNRMINASGSKVQVTSLSTSYWKKHFTGYGRIS